MNFFPYDSIEMPRGTGGIIADDKQSLSAFWNAVDELCGYQISTACGCYVFSIRAGRGVLPWYVGKAEKQSFRAECFAAHKLNIYNKGLANERVVLRCSLLWPSTLRIGRSCRHGVATRRIFSSLKIS